MIKIVAKKLSDIAEITMGQSPRSEYYNSNEEGMPFLQGNRTFGDKYPNFDTYTTNPTKIANVNDVIMSVRAPVGDLNITPKKICLGRGVCSIHMKNGNQDFLYYLMKYYVKDILNRECGTVFGSVNKNDISSLIVKIPERFEEQKKISSILSVLDDKIELNKKINRNLEAQAQAIFKSWFIDFEPFKNGKFIDSELGKIPEGWSIGTIGDISIISTGKRPDKRSTYKSNETPIPIIGASSIMGYTNKVLYDEKMLVTGRVGTHGIIQKIDFPCWPSDNTLVLKSKNLNFLHNCLLLINWKSMNRGSTQPLITQNDLKNTRIILPQDRIIQNYEQLVHCFDIKFYNNNKEIYVLSQLRDILLPKLLSGEIDVTKITV